MPDFFTRLAERTLGLANTIQPMVPSLFAPGAPLIDAEVAANQDLAIAEQTPQSDRAAPEIDAPVERQRPAQTRTAGYPLGAAAPRSVVSQPDVPPAPTVERVRPAQDEPVSRAEQNRSEPPTESSTMIESSTKFSTPPAPPAQRQPERARSDARRSEAAPLVKSPDSAPSVRANTPAIDPQPASSPSRARSLVSGQPGNLHSPDRSALLVPAADERQPQSVEPRANTMPVERPELAVREPSMPRLQPLPRSPEPPAAQPAPQIHVSIGRIEVRAVPPAPAATPQPKPAPTPRMSLDDYLRSQNGDRR